MNIGDRVCFEDEEPDTAADMGVIVEPSLGEWAYTLTFATKLGVDDVLVQWDDGDRAWHPRADLQVLR